MPSAFAVFGQVVFLLSGLWVIVVADGNDGGDAGGCHRNMTFFYIDRRCLLKIRLLSLD